jgi:hypothetical protein
MMALYLLGILIAWVFRRRETGNGKLET